MIHVHARILPTVPREYFHRGPIGILRPVFIAQQPLDALVNVLADQEIRRVGQDDGFGNFAFLLLLG
jgi:hypothetical protein